MKREYPKHSRDSSIVYYKTECIENVLQEEIQDKIQIVSINENKTDCTFLDSKNRIIDIITFNPKVNITPYTLNNMIKRINNVINTSLTIDTFYNCRIDRRRK